MEFLRVSVLSTVLVTLGLVAPSVLAETIERKVFKNCPLVAESEASLPLLNHQVNVLQGWSHAVTAPEHFSLKQSSSAYAVDSTRWQSQSDCRDEKTYQVVLVKKIGDWSQNHVNGIEPIIADKNLSFSKINAIKVTLRVNSAHTVLPSVENIQQAFAFAAKPRDLQALDQANVTLGLTLFGEHFADQAIKTANANFLLTIAPAQFNDWLTVVIPVSKMQFFWEQNYAPDFVEPPAFSKESIAGLRITPETDSGKVARSLNPDAWQEPRAELFKEMAVEFREIQLLLRP